MKSLEELLALLQSRADCQFSRPSGLPSIPPDFRLPDDLAAFYEQFSEAGLFSDDGFDPRCHILPPDQFAQVGSFILGEATTTGIECSWFALADVRDGNYIAIDLLPSRLGWCYDCFHETYGDPSYCEVIALSFTELLNHLADAEDRLFWLEDDFKGYGNAESFCR